MSKVAIVNRARIFCRECNKAHTTTVTELPKEKTVSFRKEGMRAEAIVTLAFRYYYEVSVKKNGDWEYDNRTEKYLKPYLKLKGNFNVRRLAGEMAASLKVPPRPAKSFKSC